MSRSARAGRTAAAAAAVAVLFLVLVARPALAAEVDLSPAGGPPGSTFTVIGTGFAAGEVEIRWRSEDGPLLATAEGPDFVVEASVPDDAPADSHLVVAVVREGSNLSTSSVPFEVTSREPQAVDPTTTTVPAPEDSPAPTPTTAATASDPGSGGGLGVSRAPSLGGGVDGGMADTTNGGGGEGGSDRALGAPTGAGAGGATPAAGAATDAAAGTPGAPEGATSSLPAAAGTDGAARAGAGAHDPAAAGRDGPPAPGSEVAGRSTSQSAGAVRNPALLAAGLGLVFAAGVVLTIRNRHRARAPG